MLLKELRDCKVTQVQRELLVRWCEQRTLQRYSFAWH